VLTLSIAPVRSEIRVLPRDPRWLKQIALDANVKQFGLRSFVRLAHRNFLGRDNAADVAARVV